MQGVATWMSVVDRANDLILMLVGARARVLKELEQL